VKKLLAAAMIAAAAPVALIAAAPAAMAEEMAEGEFKIPTPPPGKGQILFYRTGGISGAALGCAVFDVGAEDKLSSLGAGKYFVLVSDPGPRSFTVKSLETKDALTLEIEEGETQFVRCKIKTGFLSGRADIGPSTEKEFRAKHKNPKLVDAEDMSDAVRQANYPG
jgi:hypothetical protein